MTLRDRLVIADDNADMRWLVRLIVGERFGDVVETSDGRELFWRLVRSSYAHDEDRVVVIADVCMPVYSGLDVLAACAELDFHVPTIVITSFPSMEVAARAAELGAVVLAKPFSATELRHAVEAIQDRHDLPC